MFRSLRFIHLCPPSVLLDILYRIEWFLVDGELDVIADMPKLSHSKPRKLAQCNFINNNLERESLDWQKISGGLCFEMFLTGGIDRIDTGRATGAVDDWPTWGSCHGNFCSGTVAGCLSVGRRLGRLEEIGTMLALTKFTYFPSLGVETDITILGTS